MALPQIQTDTPESVGLFLLPYFLETLPEIKAEPCGGSDKGTGEHSHTYIAGNLWMEYAWEVRTVDQYGNPGALFKEAWPVALYYTVGGVEYEIEIDDETHKKISNALTARIDV